MLWGVYCDDFGENSLSYNSTALYFIAIIENKTEAPE